MTNPLVDFGVTHFGCAFGEERDVATTAKDYVDDPERVMGWGCDTYHRAPDDVFAVDLATEAARKALADARLDAADVDLVVLATSEMPEYLYWDSSAALARDLGIERTKTLLLDNEGCGAGITAFGHIAGAMAVHPDIETVVYAAVNRVSEHHRNRMNINDCVHSDGAAAAVLRRGHTGLRWLATEHFSDPDVCDWFRGDYGGAVAPVAPPGWTSAESVGYAKLHAHFGNDPRRLERFLSARNTNVVEAVDMALDRAGLTREDIDRAVYINDARPGAIQKITDPLGVPAERTNARFAREHGHMGAADQLVSLALHHERGDLTPGSLIALCGISTGMRWCATLLRA
ncbi:3-oxoacyl-[acyl-carrier-protein] synthase III C-terminal domain-containing protein [Streptomyces sp. NPDC048182]|uniref:3-oxoacyl-[acyl-carrier-protein] synthase III C-terminal domain-containing protein n=1 Tax=Streptomyces sp. NPDC048182 TaxID=3365507 RepID=UPI00371D1B88